jgi:hypothetical protein
MTNVPGVGTPLDMFVRLYVPGRKVGWLVEPENRATPGLVKYSAFSTVHGPAFSTKHDVISNCALDRCMFF